MTTLRFLLPLYALQTAVTPATVLSLTIDKQDGGYREVVVDIDDSVDPDHAVVEAIKALFRGASVLLSKASRGRVHFKSVVLALPGSWPRDNASKPAQEADTAHREYRRSSVDVRLLGAAAEERSGLRPLPDSAPPSPRALHSSRCGRPGRGILVSAKWLLKAAAGEDEMQLAAHQFLYEWARYRYGIFDETAIPGDGHLSSIYCDDGLVAPFCDNTTHSDNTGAPGKRNLPCGGKSMWEVIAQSEDFEGLTSPHSTKSLSTTFILTQRPTATSIVFIFDIGDMTKVGSVYAQ
ncbi:calcium-activated chloride channel regulator 1-like [Amblyomma americanum]